MNVTMRHLAIKARHDCEETWHEARNALPCWLGARAESRTYFLRPAGISSAEHNLRQCGQIQAYGKILDYPRILLRRFLHAAAHPFVEEAANVCKTLFGKGNGAR